MASQDRRIPDATVARLPEYLRILVELAEQQERTVSSGRLAELAGVNAAKVRKDLSYLGTYGTRGVGYEVEYLLYQMRQALGLTRAIPTVVVGAGNLGRALVNYKGFEERGFPIAGIVDANRALLGTAVGGLVVQHVDELGALVAARDVRIGIIAIPAKGAQDVADRLVGAGVTSILNFAPVVVAVPPGVTVRKVDLALELQILGFYQRERHHGDGPEPVVQPT